MTARHPQGSVMFERFTDRARKVAVLAQEEARGLNHDCIGTEHILLGLLREGDSAAAQVLVSMGVDLNRVRAATVRFLHEHRGKGPDGGGSGESGGRVELEMRLYRQVGG
jgi:ATP-dependent Clp protease ATP-binding subunit ClpA